MKSYWTLGFSFTFLFAIAALGDSPKPLKMAHTLSLDDFKGKTFLQAMLEPEKGIKAQLDEDFEQDYTLAGTKQVQLALQNFDKKVLSKVFKGFGNGNEGRDAINNLVSELEEKHFKPSSIVATLGPSLPHGVNPYAVTSFLAMASGAGTLVIIDDGNYYYNFGYRSGEGPKDVQSGRSYGASRKHKANDASDIFYLSELASFLKNGSTENIRAFYQTLLDVLTRCDTSGFSDLTDDGQTLATDFVAVYTAESDRHIMVKLNNKRFPWENDLAEATFVSAFDTVVDKVMMEGKLVKVDPDTGKPDDGNPSDDDAERIWWWKNNPDTGRSGIGKTQKDRRKLQRLITGYERKHHPALVSAVESYIGEDSPEGDIYEGLMEYFNQASFLTHPEGQSEIRKNARQLSKAFVDFVVQTNKDAKKIAAEIEN